MHIFTTNTLTKFSVELLQSISKIEQRVTFCMGRTHWGRKCHKRTGSWDKRLKRHIECLFWPSQTSLLNMGWPCLCLILTQSARHLSKIIFERFCELGRLICTWWSRRWGKSFLKSGSMCLLRCFWHCKRGIESSGLPLRLQIDCIRSRAIWSRSLLFCLLADVRNVPSSLSNSWIEGDDSTLVVCLRFYFLFVFTPLSEKPFTLILSELTPRLSAT